MPILHFKYIVTINCQIFIKIIMSQVQSLEEQHRKMVAPISLDRRVWMIYNELQKAIDNMDRKVQVVLKKNESEFLYAYRMHIHKIKRQLEDIKNKSEEQQKMFSSNDRIRFLEKENTLFREQAIKLYEKMENRAIQLSLAKSQALQALKISKKLEEENKQLTLEVKKIRTMESEYQKEIQFLRHQVLQKNIKIQELEEKRVIQRRRREYMDSARDQTGSLAKSRDHFPKQIPTYRNQLQQWFLQCIKSVKKEIHQRKNNLDVLDLSKISSISEFRLVDKLRLFEMLLQNQKLLSWLYSKIFPGRTDKISDYLTHATVPVTETDINSEALLSSRYGSVEQDLHLPKVGVRRAPSFSLRNQIVIKNGKMNISLA